MRLRQTGKSSERLSLIKNDDVVRVPQIPRGVFIAAL